jgi:hypothetical protein
MIILIDRLGNIHKVLAVKPQSAHPLDEDLCTVLHYSNTDGKMLVVHRLNLEDGGFYLGTYCDNMEQALSVFNAR